MPGMGHGGPGFGGMGHGGFGGGHRPPPPPMRGGFGPHRPGGCMGCGCLTLALPVILAVLGALAIIF